MVSKEWLRKSSRNHFRNNLRFDGLTVLGLLGGASVLAGILISAGVAQAAGSSFGLTLEPLVGYERVQKILPTAHTKDRLFYGVRATAGILLISAEAEVTRGLDTEDFPSQDLSIKETTDKGKFGARSTFRLSSLLSLIARAGVQARRSRLEQTSVGVTTVTIEGIRYKPYAGAGLRSALFGKFELSGEVVVVFNDFPNMRDNEYQTSLGFVLRLP